MWRVAGRWAEALDPMGCRRRWRNRPANIQKINPGGVEPSDVAGGQVIFKRLMRIGSSAIDRPQKIYIAPDAERVIPGCALEWGPVGHTKVVKAEGPPRIRNKAIDRVALEQPIHRRVSLRSTRPISGPRLHRTSPYDDKLDERNE